jgi:hypothetical protein
MLRQVAQAHPLCLLLLLKRKAKMLQLAQHALRNATRQEAAAVGANAESEGAGKARQCERSELCDGRLKEKERGGRGGKRKN